MERLARLCHRIVWLNPHKGDDRDFRPSTLGMMVAAPHIDLLLSGHDLASLEELAGLLPDLELTAGAPAVIRLGSLAGYPFEGPRLLGGWTPPAVAAVYAITCKPEPAGSRRTTRSSTSAMPTTCRRSGSRSGTRGPRAGSSGPGSKWKVYVGTYEVPGGTRAHREQIARELIAVYRPSCNAQQYDHAWKDEWIGEYSAAPTTAPVQRRGPDQRS